MRRYIWQLDDWPKLHFDAAMLLEPLGLAKSKQGELRGLMSSAGFEEQREAQLEALTEDALRTSEIEGEHLDPKSVRSSVARHLGIPQAGLPTKDAKVKGVVDVTIDATQNYNEPLTTNRLFRWQSLLFPTRLGSERRIGRIGDWRDGASGPMRVLSGPLGMETVHFEAPPAELVPAEINNFLDWFGSPNVGDGLTRAATAHLWFLTIHPFEDGNGRIARAIADMALAREEDSSTRFFSMTRQINLEKNAYYDIVERSQSQTLDITVWIEWFLACYSSAIDTAMATVKDVLRASRFWNKFRQVAFSERQRKVLSRLMYNFQGNLTVKKWAKLTGTSHDTANRDIAYLVTHGVLEKSPQSGRSTSYSLPQV
jgi:Fic family protein